ncbi:hypothetical protein J6590_040944 [Homalodisca vitripennis]|nr:hypothetical protein J6590_040944 [Homalodisca vitripennis]
MVPSVYPSKIAFLARSIDLTSCCPDTTRYELAELSPLFYIKLVKRVPAESSRLRLRKGVVTRQILALFLPFALLMRYCHLQLVSTQLTDDSHPLRCKRLVNSWTQHDLLDALNQVEPGIKARTTSVSVIIYLIPNLSSESYCQTPAGSLSHGLPPKNPLITKDTRVELFTTLLWARPVKELRPIEVELFRPKYRLCLVLHTVPGALSVEHFSNNVLGSDRIWSHSKLSASDGDSPLTFDGTLQQDVIRQVRIDYPQEINMFLTCSVDLSYRARTVALIPNMDEFRCWKRTFSQWYSEPDKKKLFRHRLNRFWPPGGLPPEHRRRIYPPTT